MIDEKPKKRPNYKGMAFHNPYNYALLGGVGAIGVLTGNWWLLIAGAGMEALWMMFAPDSKLLQKAVWDPQLGAERAELKQQIFNSLQGQLSDPYWGRFRWLLSTREEILRLSAGNPSFTIDLLREELEKVDTLTLLHGDLSNTIERYQAYLKRVDFAVLEREMRRLEGMLAGSTGDIARKNLEILERRKEKLREISDYVTKAQAQLGLIEATFQLLSDQVVTLKSPHELTGQLDELIDGVEAVRSVSREAERLLQTEAA